MTWYWTYIVTYLIALGAPIGVSWGTWNRLVLRENWQPAFARQKHLAVVSCCGQWPIRTPLTPGICLKQTTACVTLSHRTYDNNEMAFEYLLHTDLVADTCFVLA